MAPLSLTGRERTTFSPSAASLLSNDDLIGSPQAYLRILALLCATTLIVSGGFEQLQMLATNGVVPFSAALVKAALAGILFLVVLLTGRIRSPWVPMAIMLFLAYLVLDTLHLTFDRDLPVLDVLQSYNAYYGLLILAPLARAVNLRISQATIVRTLLLAFAICAAMALTQYVSNDPILRTSSADGIYNVQVWNRSPHIRVFSFFASPDLLGSFAAFMAALGVAIIIQPGRRLLGIVLLVTTLFVTYTTVVRTAFLEWIFAVVTAWAILIVRRTGWQTILQYVWLAVGTAALFFAFFRSQTGGADASVTDTSTTVIRFYEWQYYLGQFASSTPFDKVFGLGIFQGGNVSTSSVVPIDNIYIVALMHIGIFGLLVSLILFAAISKHLATLAEETRTPLVVASAAFWSTFWVTGLTQNFTFYFAAIYLLVALSDTNEVGETVEQVEVNATASNQHPALTQPSAV